jgi:succinoglycan biosynthesis transport protein ExoP
MAEQSLYQAQSREKETRADFDREIGQATVQNNQMAQLQILELDVKRMRSFYDLVLDQMKKIDMGSDSGLKISVVSEPRVPLSKCAPRISTTVLLCLFMGTVGGLGLIYVLDALDDRFRSPDELQWQLGLPMLAMIRRMDPIPGSGIDTVITHCKRDSIEAEAFRTLRSSITFSNQDTTRLVVTSTEPGDGKTTTLANLAVAFAQAGKKTLLIDADMRRPGLSQLLDLKGPRGLSLVLREDRPVAESCLENVFNLGVSNLDVMPSGLRPANPSELLSSDRFSDIVAWAEQIYDQILIDAPPVLAVTDPAIIARIVDGAVPTRTAARWSLEPSNRSRRQVHRWLVSWRITWKPVRIPNTAMVTAMDTDMATVMIRHRKRIPATTMRTPDISARPRSIA